MHVHKNNTTNPQIWCSNQITRVDGNRIFTVPLSLKLDIHPMLCTVCWYLALSSPTVHKHVNNTDCVFSLCNNMFVFRSPLTTMATDEQTAWEDGLMSVKERQVKERFCPLIRITSRVQMWNGYWLVPSLSSSAWWTENTITVGEVVLEWHWHFTRSCPSAVLCYLWC